MKKPSSNPKHSGWLKIPVTPQMVDYLIELQGTGLHGSTMGDVAERLICERLLEVFGMARIEADPE